MERLCTHMKNYNLSHMTGHVGEVKVVDRVQACIRLKRLTNNAQLGQVIKIIYLNVTFLLWMERDFKTVYAPLRNT